MRTLLSIPLRKRDGFELFYDTYYMLVKNKGHIVVKAEKNPVENFQRII